MATESSTYIRPADERYILDKFCVAFYNFAPNWGDGYVDQVLALSFEYSQFKRGVRSTDSTG